MTAFDDEHTPPPAWADWPRDARRHYLRMTMSRRDLIVLVAEGAEFDIPPEDRDRLTKAELAAVVDVLDPLGR